MKLLEVRGLTKSFSKRKVVDDVDFEVFSGEVVGLLGKNGAGKSTLFKMMIGLIKPDKGKLIFQGNDITKEPIYMRARHGVGYLSQEPSIFQKLTTEENILAILETLKYNRKEKHEKLLQLLGEFGLTKLAKMKAYTLSGGERRRLEIARSLATSPSLILLDEPFTGVDPIAITEVKDIILKLRDKGIGLLITDHNVRDALSITDRSYILDGGMVITKGTTSEILDDPIARKSYLGEEW